MESSKSRNPAKPLGYEDTGVAMECMVGKLDRREQVAKGPAQVELQVETRNWQAESFKLQGESFAWFAEEATEGFEWCSLAGVEVDLLDDLRRLVILWLLRMFEVRKAGCDRGVASEVVLESKWLMAIFFDEVCEVMLVIADLLRMVMEDGGRGWSLMSIRGVIREGASRMLTTAARLLILSRSMGGVACVQMMRQVMFVRRMLQDFDTSWDDDGYLVMDEEGYLVNCFVERQGGGRAMGEQGCRKEEDHNASGFAERPEVGGGQEVGSANCFVERQGGGRAMGEQGCRKEEDHNASCFERMPKGWWWWSKGWRSQLLHLHWRGARGGWCQWLHGEANG
jgi:hypothetical protein